MSEKIPTDEKIIAVLSWIITMLGFIISYWWFGFTSAILALAMTIVGFLYGSIAQNHAWRKHYFEKMQELMADNKQAKHTHDSNGRNESER